MTKLKSLLCAVAGLALAGCPPAYPKCESDAHCNEKGEVCVQGECRECATDQNCKPGFVCDLNRCVPKPECTSDEACGAGRACKAGKCVQAAPQAVRQEGACVSSGDCPSGQECVEGRCAVAGPVSAKCDFQPVRFEFNEFNLLAEAREALSKYADCITKEKLSFTLEGHADERGTEEYNMMLSQKRAASVQRYLADLGVPATALGTVGFGENRPAVEGANEAAWAANRRVEFRRR